MGRSDRFGRSCVKAGSGQLGAFHWSLVSSVLATIGLLFQFLCASDNNQLT